MRVGQSRKRDQVEPAIVKALRQLGAKVIRLSEPGCPDLLVLWRGRLILMECKGGTGKLTMAQQLNAGLGWPMRIVRSVEDALKAIGATK